MRELAFRFFREYGFIFLGVTLVGIVVACGCHLRLRRVRRRELLSRKVEDALVQNTQGLILKVHGIVKELPAGDPTRRRMETALDQADQQLSSDRDRVQDLRTQAVLDGGEALEDSGVPTSASRPPLTARVRSLLRRFTFRRRQ